MTYFACEKMSSLEVRTPIQQQLRRVVLSKPIYTPLPKLEVDSDDCSTKIKLCLLLLPIMLVLEKPPIIPNYASTIPSTHNIPSKAYWLTSSVHVTYTMNGSMSRNKWKFKDVYLPVDAHTQTCAITYYRDMVIDKFFNKIFKGSLGMHDTFHNTQCFGCYNYSCMLRAERKDLVTSLVLRPWAFHFRPRPPSTTGQALQYHRLNSDSNNISVNILI